MTPESGGHCSPWTPAFVPGLWPAPQTPPDLGRIITGHPVYPLLGVSRKPRPREGMRLAQGHRASRDLEPRPRGSLSSSVPPVPIARAGVREPGTNSETEVTRLRIRTDTSALDLLGEHRCIISPSYASVSLMRLLPPFLLQRSCPRHSRPQESNLLCATHPREGGTRTERTCLQEVLRGVGRRGH